jgi:hypothetical protein
MRAALKASYRIRNKTGNKRVRFDEIVRKSPNSFGHANSAKENQVKPPFQPNGTRHKQKTIGIICFRQYRMNLRFYSQIAII